jgi:hypothetical protein
MLLCFKLSTIYVSHLMPYEMDPEDLLRINIVSSN